MVAALASPYVAGAKDGAEVSRRGLSKPLSMDVIEPVVLAFERALAVSAWPSAKRDPAAAVAPESARPIVAQVRASASLMPRLERPV
jgi:hypothetical protein